MGMQKFQVMVADAVGNVVYSGWVEIESGQDNVVTGRRSIIAASGYASSAMDMPESPDDLDQDELPEDPTCKHCNRALYRKDGIWYHFLSTSKYCRGQFPRGTTAEPAWEGEPT
jgi:hypothetical protein